MRAAWTFVLLVAACSPTADSSGPPPDSPLSDPSRPLPATMRELGLFPDAPNLDTTAETAVAYAPAYPLWSNGSDKQRHLALPEGETIDTRAPDAWAFPVGTLLFKTFAYEGVPVETRVMVRTAEDDWEYEVYAWSDDGEDAQLLSLDERVVVPVAGGSQHTIPARLDCRVCHETAADPVLGMTRVQLSHDQALGPGLDAATEAGLLSDAVDSAPRIEDTAPPGTGDVLRSFYGNCVHCHHGGDGDNASFDLRPDVALANSVGQPTASSAAAAGIRIVPGDPSQSMLFLAVSGEHDDPEIKNMPPVGVDVRDAASIETLRSFIGGLPQ
jgi:hypothetical protein